MLQFHRLNKKAWRSPKEGGHPLDVGGGTGRLDEEMWARESMKVLSLWYLGCWKINKSRQWQSVKLFGRVGMFRLEDKLMESHWA